GRGIKLVTQSRAKEFSITRTQTAPLNLLQELLERLDQVIDPFVIQIEVERPDIAASRPQGAQSATRIVGIELFNGILYAFWNTKGNERYRHYRIETRTPFGGSGQNAHERTLKLFLRIARRVIPPQSEGHKNPQKTTRMEQIHFRRSHHAQGFG